MGSDGGSTIERVFLVFETPAPCTRTPPEEAGSFFPEADAHQSRS